MSEYVETNRSLWNNLAEINLNSEFYDLEGFKAGKSKLTPIELEELKDVSGRTMLHLQCHFGLDTMSWARMGAEVTGIDFSPKAISLARSLSEELNIPARFICSELFDLPNNLDDKFDIVFTSYGAITWIENLNEWAKLIARYLKPGGLFYIVEFHPFLSMFDDNGEKLEDPYFHSPQPTKYTAQGSYADPDADFTHDSYEWFHNIGEVVTALISAGLKIDYLHEFPYSPYNCTTFFTEDSPGKYVMKKHPNIVPLVFSIQATRE
ncbi:MAG: methyltransferase domain-containing protein [candidate division Zixibacteria bacterium]|nr:methyltransferase domain-containing protein [candidate division Zixibacteria bacterium]